MAAEQMPFEEQLKRLQAVVDELERGDVPLEASVALYKEGIELARACREQLELARSEVTILADGAVQPFAVSDEAAEEPGGTGGMDNGEEND